MLMMDKHASEAGTGRAKGRVVEVRPGGGGKWGQVGDSPVGIFF